jgi:transposase
MAQSSKLLDKTVVEIAKKELQKLGKSGKIAIKLQALIAASTHGITKVADILGYTRATITSWIKLLKSGDVSALNDKPKTPRRSLLTEEQKQMIGEWIKEDSNITILGLCAKVKENIGITISKSTMHRIMQKLNFSYITPRPKHYKQDVERQEEFKKKSTTTNKRNRES